MVTDSYMCFPGIFDSLLVSGHVPARVSECCEMHTMSTYEMDIVRWTKAEALPANAAEIFCSMLSAVGFVHRFEISWYFVTLPFPLGERAKGVVAPVEIRRNSRVLA